MSGVGGVISPPQSDWSTIWPGNEDKYKKPSTPTSTAAVVFFFLTERQRGTMATVVPVSSASVHVLDAGDPCVFLHLAIIH